MKFKYPKLLIALLFSLVAIFFLRDIDGYLKPIVMIIMLGLAIWSSLTEPSQKDIEIKNMEKE